MMKVFKKYGLQFTVYGLLSTIVYGYTITHTDYTSGGSITASGQNANENAIVNLLNGNIDTTNIAANGVGTTQIAANAVTTAKIAANAVTASQIANGTITDTQISANGLNGNVDLASGTVQGSSANSSGVQGSITQGTISTPDLRANAVTQAATGSRNTTTAASTLVSSFTMTTSGGPVIIIAHAVFRCTSGQPAVIFTVENGVGVIASCETEPEASIAALWFGSCAAEALDSQAAGVHTYTMNWNNVANCAVTTQQYGLIGFELKR